MYILYGFLFVFFLYAFLKANKKNPLTVGYTYESILHYFPNLYVTVAYLFIHIKTPQTPKTGLHFHVRNIF